MWLIIALIIVTGLFAGFEVYKLVCDLRARKKAKLADKSAIDISGEERKE